MANQTRIGWRSLVVTQVVNAVDADAQAFITAAGITNLTQASAINTLVNDLKTYGLWTKMKALYPMVGGTATSHKFNLKDPRDLNAAYRLVFYGGWTHTSTGALPNGTTGYADINLKPFSVFNNSTYVHIAYYSRTSSGFDNSEYGMGVIDGISNLCFVLRRLNNTQAFFSTFSNATYQWVLNTTSTDGSGLFVGTQQGTGIKLLKNNILQGSNTQLGSTTPPNLNVFIGALNLNGLPSNYTNKETAFASIGDGLTDAESSNFYTAVQAYQTTLGRQIGSPIVSDTDAQAFINAAGLTDLGQANAVNTLVTDLKAAGVWTKMKAVYPFVGGNATSHKFNLKDPRDLDAAFRLTFSGGWTHTSTGALPNGINATANTLFNPVTQNLNVNNNSLSVYLRTNNTPINCIDIGQNFNQWMSATWWNYLSLVYIYNPNSVMLVNNVGTTSNNLSINTRRSSTDSAFFINGSKTGTCPFTNTYSFSSANVHLASAGGTGYYSPREQAFASIGDGLSDTEASALYTAIQKYQTSLGRQIGTPVLASGQTAGLLDTYSGAAVAYSLRKLRNGYYGNAIRVRRSSDNAEQDIAFNTSGGLDTVSLLAFVGTGNGFVTTWYDQSGNLSNLIQTTAANQARIVYNGALETLNGKPALVTNYNYSTSGFYKATYSSTINGPATVFNIGSNVASPGATYLWDGLNTPMYAYSYNNTWIRMGGSAEFALTGYSQGITTQRIINAIYNGASSKLRINNSTYATGNTGTIAATGLTLGAAYNGTLLAAAYNQEHIVYPSNQETNATNINTNINSYYTIY
jgi:hypothetical protein